MKKAESEGTLRAQQCPDIKSRKIADLSENSPKYRKPGSLRKNSLPFFVLFGAFRPHRRIFAERAARNLRTVFRLFSCQTSQKQRSGDFSSSTRELSRHRS
jgi:hypothetical protein